MGSMLVLLSAMVSIVTGVLFPTTGMSLEPYLTLLDAQKEEWFCTRCKIPTSQIKERR